jgi:PAS domain S-box-containing protein
MKISFKKIIPIGYFINILVVFALGFIYWNQFFKTSTKLWDWLFLLLIVLSLAMLTTIYFIIKAQLKARNKSDFQLLQNKKLLQSIIDNTTNPISVKKINGEYLLINKQYEILFNLKSENIKGKTDHDFLPKKIADQYRNSDLEVLKLSEEIQIEETIEQADGPHVYLAVKFPLFDEANRVFAIGTIATDITERKSIEQSLIAGNTFFNMSMDMLIIASQNMFIKINPALSKTLGYSENELKSKPFTNYILPEDILSTEKEIEKLQKGTSLVNFKNRWICSDGTIKWLTWNATADINTGLIYAIAHDITEQLKLKEEEQVALNELYASEQKLNLILENISDGVIVVNANKEVILANNMANALFGIEDDSKISANFSNHFELFFPDENKTFPEQNLPMERALLGEATDNIEVVLLNPVLKKKNNVLLSGRPIINTKNEVIAAVITIKDITQYKMMEAKLKTALKYRNLIGFKKNDKPAEK